MTDSGEKPPVFHIPAPGYFVCRRRIRRLRRLQDLIRHREEWPEHIGFAQPLDTLIPDASDSKRSLKSLVLIDQEISRLVVAVRDDLGALGVSTSVSTLIDSDDSKEMFNGKQVRHSFDLLTDYFLIPRGNPATSFDIFSMTIRALDEGIGAYEIMAARAKWHFINPLMWCVWILRAPVFVLRESGLATGAAAGDKALRIVGWLVGMLLLVILPMVALRLGISIPWDKLWEVALKLFSKL